jgi:putative DNA primase/helicase
VKNGLLDIRTNELKPHTPDFVTLIQSPVVYDPLAPCHTWNKVLEAWTAGDEQEEKATILQQFAGYCLTSSTNHGKALFLIGDGGNGKSTYADTIGMIIGDKATSRISLENIYTQFGVAGLIGKRLNIIEEISANYFHGHTLKSLITGEEVSANIKYQDSFKFKPQAKFIFSVNQMPRVDDASSGMERRILAVNFHNNFRDNPNIDLRFSNGLLAKELSGILNWAILGAQLLMYNKGFVETEEKKRIIQDYREENSSVDGFIAECVAEKQGEVISIPDLYEVYREFCQKDGRTPKARIGFTKELKMHAHKTRKFSFIHRVNGKGDAKIEGIGLTDRWQRNFTSTFEREF